MNSLSSAYSGLRVLVTGHTGFKGAWLSIWLSDLGAQVYGFAQPPERPSLYEQAEVEGILTSEYADIRDFEAVSSLMARTKPDIVFHLAAQSLVGRGYASPIETLSTNVMGTAHVLESIRANSGQPPVVVVTSDKCYHNDNLKRSFRETDALGGKDPYSCSKACAELVAAAYRDSYFSDPASALIATVRAGNVIGGGDWSKDRLMPDVARALMDGEPAIVRNPTFTRPWQHVLEPLRAYLLLGARLLKGDADYASAWNIGPDDEHSRTVLDLATIAIGEWGSGTLEEGKGDPTAPEAEHLHLDSTKARDLLGYRPILGFEESVRMTVAWYKRFAEAADIQAFTIGQIRRYSDSISDGR